MSFLKEETVGIAQLVRAPDCGSGGRGFDSHYSPHLLEVKSWMLECKLFFAGPFPKNDFALASNFSPLTNILGCSQVGKAPDFDSGISQVRVLPSQPSHKNRGKKKAQKKLNIFCIIVFLMILSSDLCIFWAISSVGRALDF